MYNLINHDLYNTSVKINEKSYLFWAVHFFGATLCADISRLPSSCTASTTFEQCRLDGTGILQLVTVGVGLEELFWIKYLLFVVFLIVNIY